MASVVFAARAPGGAWRFRSRFYRRWCYRAGTGDFAPLYSGIVTENAAP